MKPLKEKSGILPSETLTIFLINKSKLVHNFLIL